MVISDCFDHNLRERHEGCGSQLEVWLITVPSVYINMLALKHFASYISTHKIFWKIFLCKVKRIRKISLFDVVAEVVLVLYSNNLRRTELLERETEGLYFLYCYCECVANR